MLGDMRCHTGCIPSDADTVEIIHLGREGSHNVNTHTLGGGSVDGTTGVGITTVGGP